MHPFKHPPDWEALSRQQLSARYYNPDVHIAAFVLPHALHRAHPLHDAPPQLHDLAPDAFPVFEPFAPAGSDESDDNLPSAESMLVPRVSKRGNRTLDPPWADEARQMAVTDARVG